MTIMLLASPLQLQLLAHDLEWLARRDRPSDRDITNAPCLDAWHLHFERVPVLVGRVSGHPELADGLISTSPLFAIDREGQWARTMSRWYRLTSRDSSHG